MPNSPALNELLREQLTAIGCRRGKFDTSGDGRRSSLAGTRPDGRAAFVWTFPRALNVAVAAYLEESCPPDLAQLSIRIDLDAGTFHYELTTRQAANKLAAAEAKQEKQRRHQLPRDPAPYGAALAGQVADALKRRGFLGYEHRDYCGLGLEYKGGNYHYGSIWDGILEPLRTFSDRPAFVGWLAAQSDAALSQVNQRDEWLWDNQTLTRQRLLEFVRGA